MTYFKKKFLKIINIWLLNIKIYYIRLKLKLFAILIIYNYRFFFRNILLVIIVVWKK